MKGERGKGIAHLGNITRNAKIIQNEFGSHGDSFAAEYKERRGKKVYALGLIVLL